MSYWGFKRDKRRWIRKCPVCKKKAELRLTRSSMGNHPNNDKVWFRVRCTFCSTRTKETEGCWADEVVVKEWNSRDIIIDKAVSELLECQESRPNYTLDNFKCLSCGAMVSKYCPKCAKRFSSKAMKSKSHIKKCKKKNH